VDWLTEKMRSNNFTVSAMHGDMPQKERDAIMAEFRSGTTRVLITTDVWARGLDVQQVSSLPAHYILPKSVVLESFPSTLKPFFLQVVVVLCAIMGLDIVVIEFFWRVVVCVWESLILEPLVLLIFRFIFKRSPCKYK
jgi:hypothetical protein